MRPVRSDAHILRDVARELHWDPRVEEGGLGVDVTDGLVTLAGMVGSWAARVAAGAAARRVFGVRDVVNRVTVAPPGRFVRGDAEIEEAARRALEWDVLVPHHRITVTVAGGSLRLAGNVELWSHREDAERAIQNLTGVRDVINDIVVNEPGRTSEDVQQAIEEALERWAERNARRITVRIEDGKAVLFGAVRSWAERDAIVAAARYTRGVQDVDDRLRLDPLG